MNNRIWQAAIVVLLHCTMASAHSFEVDGIYYSITSSADSTVAVTYRGNNYGSYSNEYSGVITIPKTVTYDGKTYKVTSIAQYTFYKCDITSVTLHEGIIEIGDGAFCKCSSLTYNMIPEGVTSIGDSFFSGCSSLTFIDIPKGVTEIGGNAFSECRSLTSITIPHKVKAIGGNAFYRCTSIKEVIIEDGCDTLQLGENTTVGLFFDCPLETIYLGRNINYRYGKSYGYSPFFRNNNISVH